MMRLHPIFSLFLAAVLALASVTSAVARNQMAGSVRVEICGADTAATVTPDANGQPIRAPHHCPDCLAGVSVHTASAQALPAPPTGRVCGVCLPRRDIAQGFGGPQPAARGPPLSI